MSMESDEQASYPVNMIAPLKKDPAPHRKRWTADELLAMEKAGLLDPEQHVELIDGEVYEIAMGEDHADVVDQLNEVLVAKFAGRARVRVQNPVFLDQNDLPQPDFALLDPAQNYKSHHPKPENTYLVIEVSDSTLVFDRGKQLKRYARMSVQEVWIINLQDRQTEVFRNPQGEEYLTRFVVQPGQTGAPLSFPNDAIAPL